MLRKLLEEAAGQEVIMTTISSRIPFYEPEGFERLQLKDVPRYGVPLHKPFHTLPVQPG